MHCQAFRVHRRRGRLDAEPGPELVRGPLAPALVQVQRVPVRAGRQEPERVQAQLEPALVQRVPERVQAQLEPALVQRVPERVQAQLGPVLVRVPRVPVPVRVPRGPVPVLQALGPVQVRVPVLGRRRGFPQSCKHRLPSCTRRN